MWAHRTAGGRTWSELVVVAEDPDPRWLTTYGNPAPVVLSDILEPRILVVFNVSFTSNCWRRTRWRCYAIQLSFVLDLEFHTDDLTLFFMHR